MHYTVLCQYYLDGEMDGWREGVLVDGWIAHFPLTRTIIIIEQARITQLQLPHLNTLILRPDSDEGKRYTGLQSPVYANRPPLYVPPLSKSAADRNVATRPVPTTVTVQQEEKSKPPTATSLYEKRFRGGAVPAHVSYYYQTV